MFNHITRRMNLNKQLPKAYTPLRWANMILFFEDIDTCIVIRNSLVKVVTISTQHVWKINIKYVYNAIACKKYDSLFVLSNYNGNISNIFVIYLKDNSYKKLKYKLKYEPRSMFISSDQEEITIIETTGRVVIVKTSTLECRECFRIGDYIGPNTHDGRYFNCLELYNTQEDSYIGYVNTGNNVIRKYKVELSQGKFDFIQHKTYSRKEKNNFTYHYIGELNLEIYVFIVCGDNFPYCNNVTCEFQRDGEYLFHFDIGSGYVCPMISFCYFDNVVFMNIFTDRIFSFDIEQKSAKYLSVYGEDIDAKEVLNEGKSIGEIFCFSQRKWIICTFVEKKTDTYYTLEDFKSL